MKFFTTIKELLAPHIQGLTPETLLKAELGFAIKTDSGLWVRVGHRCHKSWYMDELTTSNTAQTPGYQFSSPLGVYTP